MQRIHSIVFFGTPEFAVPTLEALCTAGRRPRLVVTQPARAAGRGQLVRQPPVVRAAAGHGLVVSQPQRLGDDGFGRRLRDAAPDVGVVVAYGRILPAWMLSLPRLGCINLHASLLPRWRGAAPIQAALAAGDPETGVTTMQMDEGLDTGPILLQRHVAIERHETAGELAPRLAAAGAELILETLARLETESLQPRPQDAASATYAARLRREDGRVDWERPAEEIFNRWRAFNPWPGLTASLRDRPVKLARAEPAPSVGHGSPGEILALGEDAISVACGAGSVLRLLVLQRPGRRTLAAPEFVRGERLAIGDRFA